MKRKIDPKQLEHIHFFLDELAPNHKWLPLRPGLVPVIKDAIMKYCEYRVATLGLSVTFQFPLLRILLVLLAFHKNATKSSLFSVDLKIDGKPYHLDDVYLIQLDDFAFNQIIKALQFCSPSHSVQIYQLNHLYGCEIVNHSKPYVPQSYQDIFAIDLQVPESY